jgi:hypothetical protein
VTVVETVYHQPFNSEPTSQSSAFSRPLETAEQPYRRSLVVGEAWQPLDLGWLKNVGVGMLCISNEEGRHPQTVPTAEELAETKARVVEVAYGCESPDGWEVPPGESLRACPSNAGALQIRCRHGVAQVTIFAIPR